MKTRIPSRRLVSTYVSMKKGKYEARAVDARTKKEARCSKDELQEAIACSREKAGR